MDGKSSFEINDISKMVELNLKTCWVFFFGVVSKKQRASLFPPTTRARAMRWS